MSSHAEPMKAPSTPCHHAFTTKSLRNASSILSPLVLAADLIFLLRSEVILDVERLTNLLWRLSLDHVGDSLATNIKKGLDVQVVGGLK